MNVSRPHICLYKPGNIYTLVNKKKIRVFSNCFGAGDFTIRKKNRDKENYENLF